MQQRLDYRKASPAAVQAMLQLQATVQKSGLEPSLIEVIKIRASRKAGETEERIYLLDAWRESSLYTPRERAALAWTDTLTLVAEKGVSDAAFEEVRAHFSEAEMVDLTLAVVAINGWNRIAIGFNLQHPAPAKTVAA
jgi:alkylhydroperoxidase family enzyme